MKPRTLLAQDGPGNPVITMFVTLLRKAAETGSELHEKLWLRSLRSYIERAEKK